MCSRSCSNSCLRRCAMFSSSCRSMSVVPHTSIDNSSSEHNCSKTDWVAWAQLLVYHGVLLARCLEVGRLHEQVLPPESGARVLPALCLFTFLDSASEYVHMRFRHRAAQCTTLSDYINIHPRYVKGLPGCSTCIPHLP